MNLASELGGQDDVSEITTSGELEGSLSRTDEISELDDTSIRDLVTPLTTNDHERVIPILSHGEITDNAQASQELDGSTKQVQAAVVSVDDTRSKSTADGTRPESKQECEKDAVSSALPTEPKTIL